MNIPLLYIIIINNYQSFDLYLFNTILYRMLRQSDCQTATVTVTTMDVQFSPGGRPYLFKSSLSKTVRDSLVKRVVALPRAT